MGPPSTRQSGPIPGSAAYAREHPAASRRSSSIPGSAAYAQEHPVNTCVQGLPNPVEPQGFADDPLDITVVPVATFGDPLATSMLQDTLRTLNARPPTPAAFVATVRVKHDAIPEPDIWTPSPRSSPDEIDDLTAGAALPLPASRPDEIDDLTARAALPLPASRPDSDASRASSRASSVDVPVNVAATPLPTPDYSAISDEHVDGLLHPSFSDRAILDDKDKRHFLGRGDLSVTSLKLVVPLTALATIFVVLSSSSAHNSAMAIWHNRCRNLSTPTNRKMADEYMRLRDVASTWKQKAKDNAKNAKEGRKAREELMKARGDIAAILEEREILIRQRREFLAKDDQMTTELNRVHRDYGNAIDDNAKFAANIETLEQNMALVKDELNNTKNLLSMAEHHRDKAEQDCGIATLRFDKEAADRKRDKAFYEARILALSGPAVPTSQPDSENPLSAAAIDKAALVTRVNNLKKEMSQRCEYFAR
ncbi:hypothetical protein AX14_007543 [Amanita brunnescens Koide BX004]|nr:hypothetical protein AX14_007543 [Amanita brunnescens Koide BX004]